MKTKGNIKIWAILLWIVIWHLLSIAISNKIFLVSPVDVVLKLSDLVFQESFWISIFNSTWKILLGFFLALILAIILATISFRFSIIKDFLAPFIIVMKSIPVASFIILILIWFDSKNLSIIIPQLIVFPMVYENVLTGYFETDNNLLEMAQVFKLSFKKKLKYIYIPQVLPYIAASQKTGIGLSFKSGIAAELIGLPDGSIGENLQRAKVFLQTSDLFAWTLVIIVLSLLCEKILTFLFGKLTDRILG